ncbi:MAG: hypothetical protein ACEQSR_14265 [Candidatus Methylacidiphilales bacterium]
MKIINQAKSMKAIIIASIFIGFMACKKEIKDIGVPSSKLEGLQASWKLTSCSMVDELSLTKESVKMGDVFTKGSINTPNIKFETVAGIRKYTVDTTNLLVNFFQKPTGTWNFDSDEFPTLIQFVPDGGTAFELPLGGPIRTVDAVLKLRKPIYCGGELKFSYVLEFERK